MDPHLPAGQQGQQTRHADAGRHGPDQPAAEPQLIALGVGDGQGLPDAGEVLELQGVVADDDQVVVADGHAHTQHSRHKKRDPGPADQAEQQQGDAADDGIVHQQDQRLFKKALEDLRTEIAVGQEQRAKSQNSAGNQQQAVVIDRTQDSLQRPVPGQPLPQQQRHLRRVLFLPCHV